MIDDYVDKVLIRLQDKFTLWVERVFKTIFKDVAELADSFYPVFIIVCLLGIFLTMTGNKKGSKISSTSFISYLIVRVILSAYK